MGLLKESLANALTTSFSIFSALLFNLLLLVYDISEKDSNLSNKNLPDLVAQKRQNSRRKLLQEVYINVSFSILIATVAVVLLLFYFLLDTIGNSSIVCTFTKVVAFGVYYLAIQFLLTLFMVLKRIYRLLSKAFE